MEIISDDSSNDVWSDDNADLDLKYHDKRYKHRVFRYFKDLLNALMESAADVHEDVRAEIMQTICKLGSKNPYSVLKYVFEYLTNRNPQNFTQRICIVEAVSKICSENGDKLSLNEANRVILLLVNEMLFKSEFIPQLQSNCSDALISLGQTHCFKIMDCLSVRMKSDRLPHFYVLYTMGSLATVDVFTMLPFIKAILGQLVHMMSVLRDDNLKWAFAFVFTKFSECITEYLSNIENAPDPLVKKDFYSTEIQVAFEFLFNNWLNSKELKTRLQTVNCLGSMCYIVNVDFLASTLPRLLPSLLILYKRVSGEAYTITCGLSAMLDAARQIGKHVLEKQLDALLQALFVQVCAPPDIQSYLPNRTQNEILRCFDILAKSMPDSVVAFNLERLLSSQVTVCCAALTVLKHLINVSEHELSTFMPEILSAIRSLLEHPSRRVQKIITQVIIMFATKGLFNSMSDVLLYLHFILKHCCLKIHSETKSLTNCNTKSANSTVVVYEEISEFELVQISESSLLLLCTNCPHKLLPFLWPALPQFFLCAEYTPASVILLKCCIRLQSQQYECCDLTKKCSHKYINDIQLFSNIFALMFVMLGIDDEMHHTKRVVPAGLFLKSLGQMFNDVFSQIWQKNLDCLIDSFSDFTENEITKWRNNVIYFLRETIDAIQQNLWKKEFGGMVATMHSVSASLSSVCVRSYSSTGSSGNANISTNDSTLSRSASANSESQTLVVDFKSLVISFQHLLLDNGRLINGCKGFLTRCLAECAIRSNDLQFVSILIDNIFTSTVYENIQEREACSAALGTIASVHHSLVVAKLDSVVRIDLARRHLNLLGFIKDNKAEQQKDFLRVTVILCYGRIAKCINIHSFIEFLDISFFTNLSTFLDTCKSNITRNAVATLTSDILCGVRRYRCANLGVTSPQPSSTQETLVSEQIPCIDSTAIYQIRDILLSFIIAFIREMAQSIDTSCMHDNLVALANLLCLEPVPAGSVLYSIFALVVSVVFSDVNQSMLINLSNKSLLMDQIEILMSSLIDISQEPLVFFENILTVMSTYMVSAQTCHRLHSISLIGLCLARYKEISNRNTDMEISTSIPNIGILLSILVSHCFDDEIAVRSMSISAIYNVVYVWRVSEVNTRYILRLDEAKSLLLDSVDVDVEKIVEMLTEVLSPHLSVTGLVELCDSLCDYISSQTKRSNGSQPFSSSDSSQQLYVCTRRCVHAASIFIWSILSRRGTDLYQRVDSLFAAIYRVLLQVDDVTVTEYLHRSIRTLSFHHLVQMANIFKAFSIPFDACITSCLLNISSDQQLSVLYAEHYMDFIFNSSLFEEILLSEKRYMVKLDILSALVALRIVLSACSSDRLNVARTLARLLVLQSCFIDTSSLSASGTMSLGNNASEKLSNVSLDNLHPYRLVVDAFVACLRSASMSPLADTFLNSIDSVSPSIDLHAKSVQTFASDFLANYPIFINDIVSFLLPELSSKYENCRIVVLAFFSQIFHFDLFSIPVDLSTVELLFSSFLSHAGDESYLVRLYAAYGLGNLSNFSQVVNQSNSITQCCNEDLKSFTDKHIRSSMGALHSLLSETSTVSSSSSPQRHTLGEQALESIISICRSCNLELIRGYIIQICGRLRLCFESSSSRIRSLSFSLFGLLSTKDLIQCPQSDSILQCEFIDCLHANLMSIFMHLGESSSQVAQSCLRTALQTSQLFHSERYSTFLHDYLSDKTFSFQDFIVFLTNMSQILIEEFPLRVETMVSSLTPHMKSQWCEIRSYSVILIALVVRALPKERNPNINLELIRDEFQCLLRDPSQTVRVSVIKAIALLYE